jgi:hypothetical protein
LARPEEPARPEEQDRYQDDKCHGKFIARTQEVEGHDDGLNNADDHPADKGALRIAHTPQNRGGKERQEKDKAELRVKLRL